MLQIFRGMIDLLEMFLKQQQQDWIDCMFNISPEDIDKAHEFLQQQKELYAKMEQNPQPYSKEGQIIKYARELAFWFIHSKEIEDPTRTCSYDKAVNYLASRGKTHTLQIVQQKFSEDQCRLIYSRSKGLIEQEGLNIVFDPLVR